MGMARTPGSVSLPVLFSVPEGQHFDCHGCTRCCRELVVHLTAEEARRIDAAGWAATLGVSPWVRRGAARVLNHRDGACVFLMAEGRCRIHAERGAAEKPLACRMYPFTLESEASAVRASIRFDCPTVARNGGGPALRHREEVRRLAAEAQAAGLMAAGRGAWPLCGGVSVSDETMDRVLAPLERWAGREKVGVGARLAGLLSWAREFSCAKLGRLEEGQIAELAAMLAQEMEADAGTRPHSLEPGTAHRAVARGEPGAAQRAVAHGSGFDEAAPTKRQRTLFLQAVYAHCEHVWAADALAGPFRKLARRWGQIGEAMRMTSGRGAAPALAGFRGGATTFEAVEAVSAEDVRRDAAVQAMLSRYLAARIGGRTAFGPAYYGWALTDGILSLGLAFAVMGWLARYSAAVGGRDAATFEDVVAAVSAVDRNAGRAKELGARSAALRLRYMVDNDAIGGLLERYRMWDA